MSRIMTCARGIAALLQGASYEDTGLPECFLPTPERLAKHALRTAADGVGKVERGAGVDGENVDKSAKGGWGCVVA